MLLSRRRAVLVVLLPVTVAWTAFFSYDALVVDPLRDDVVAEMGVGYYVQQVVAAVLPAGAVVGGVMVARKRNPGTRPARLLMLVVGAALHPGQPVSPFANFPN